MRQHGGTLEAHSSGLGHGTTVSLKLDCFVVNSVNANSSNLNEDSNACQSMEISRVAAYLQYGQRCHTSPDHNLQNSQHSIMNPTSNVICVLIVDDSHLNRKVIKQGLSIAAKKFSDFQLNSCVFDFNEADDGTSAVEKVQSAVIPFDVIFMDNVMSKMNGTEATKILRKQLGFSGPIYGITGNALDDDIADFKNHGVDEVLTKPVCWKDLEKLLRIIISKKYGRQLLQSLHLTAGKSVRNSEGQKPTKQHELEVSASF